MDATGDKEGQSCIDVHYHDDSLGISKKGEEGTVLDTHRYALVVVVVVVVVIVKEG